MLTFKEEGGNGIKEHNSVVTIRYDKGFQIGIPAVSLHFENMPLRHK